MTLDQPIQIKRKDQLQQADGSLQTTLSTVADCFAKAKVQRGSESSQSDQIDARSSCVFIIHTRSDLLEDDVIVWNSRTYNIRFIHDSGLGAIYMDIEAERGVAI